MLEDRRRTIEAELDRRIEAEDPDRHLVGLENRLKGKDRLSEKVTTTDRLDLSFGPASFSTVSA